jgi:type II secretory pathway pseudopilin PulG
MGTPNKTKLAGFTFVEIVVVLAIFAAITATLLFNFRDFTEGVSLQNLTQNIALQISTAQRQSIAGSRYGYLVDFPVTISEWKPSYGVCFTTDSSGCYLNGNYYYTGQNSAGVTAFHMFADNNSQVEEFETDGADNHLDVIEILGGDHISSICINGQTTNTCQNISEVSVVFTRPDTAPRFFIPGNISQVDDVTIQVTSPEGTNRKVIVWGTGQIEVR